MPWISHKRPPRTLVREAFPPLALMVTLWQLPFIEGLVRDLFHPGISDSSLSGVGPRLSLLFL